MSDDHPAFHRLKPVRDLPSLAGRAIVEDATQEERAAVAAAFGLVDLPSLNVEATITAIGRDGWRVVGRLSARAVQNCVVTLEPVEQKIDEPFERAYDPEVDAVGDLEIDLDPNAEDPPEPLGAGIDLGVAALETLALALDPYPRAPGVAFAPVNAPPPGAEPITEETLKPFAGLAALKKTMESGD